MPTSSPTWGRSLALIGAGLTLYAAFLPWTSRGRAAVDLAPSGLPATSGRTSLAVLLLAVAALPAIAAVIGDHAWPRLLSAVVSATLVVAWVTNGPDGAVTTGVAVVMSATVTYVFSAALATEPEHDGTTED